ncbi:MAG: DUF262 domain-containing protein [Chthonomonas sp.]|nr:DUF262 domain-containing protein [Chthonomonas sp.]
MSYKTETIASTIARLNTNFYLPAIQREFVWDSSQIIQLFDSILRGYPISSFLFWSIESENYEKWRAYQFLIDGKDGGIHNPEANLSAVSDLHLILDGQQRLTSLNIGLRGTYTVKKKYGRKDNPDAWSRRTLFLDILHDPLTLVDPNYEDIFFRFEFRDKGKGGKANGDSRWFEVGKILSFKSDREFDEYRDEFVESIDESTTKEQRRAARMNLDRLYRAIHKDDVIAYYVEREQDYDRVLDVFVRANSGGTKLSKSDLLMSTITASWGNVDARHEIQSLVDRLNRSLPRRSEIDKDFVMKASLVINDLPIKYRVQNFTDTNLLKIKENWTESKKAIGKAVDLLSAYGITGDTLTSTNALIPIVYFYSKRRDLRPDGTSIDDVLNAKSIHAWLVLALLRGQFRSSADSALSKARDVIRKAVEGNKPFPLLGLIAESEDGGSAELLNGIISETMDLSYSSSHIRAVLSLFYSGAQGAADLHIDHIFPKSTRLPSDDYDKQMFWWNSPLNKTSNLCLLSAAENQEKSATSFEEWITTRDPSFLERNFIPNDATLYSVDRFEQFMDERSKLLEGHLRKLLAPALEAR